MTEPVEPNAAPPKAAEPQPTLEQPALGPAPRSRRWTAVAAAAVVSLLVGGGIGAGVMAALSDPTESDEYQALEADLRDAERDAARAEDDSDAPASTSAAPTSSSEDPGVGVVGEPVTNQGVTLTVTGAQVVDVIELNETSYAPGSGFEEYTPTNPDPGGKFVVVQTHIVNNAQVSMDLTCSYPIANALIDSRDRQFDTIDSLYKLRGNPECNDQLQPGFEADMTYVYMVPADADIVGFAFADATDFSNPSSDYSAVRLNV
ncbi:hypothetical protein [Geodermatophilus sabuli]|uniref:DUF4352 domain-containing protein n=1 Tax=Geodermatophilus sabuli TaxID=1564158 RepID=A0A285EBL7_9ACTN|nr:hypothetical protein [Geodermatophilus sabuli]MBB3084210.1 hypothetical protein [Geodermatophilus sabuli]SNX96518.1 hypothetical protein SAMN06893097_104233 [Geodermatophilus sabuli]